MGGTFYILIIIIGIMKNPITDMSVDVLIIIIEAHNLIGVSEEVNFVPEAGMVTHLEIIPIEMHI